MELQFRSCGVVRTNFFFRAVLANKPSCNPIIFYVAINGHKWEYKE